MNVWGNDISESRLFKINGNLVTLSNDFPANILQNSGKFTVVSDTEIWLSGYNLVNWRNGEIIHYNESDVGGNLNAQYIYVYNDSTVFVFSNYGFYVYKSGHWYYPVIPSNRLINEDAYIWCLDKNKIYLDGWHSPLVIQDVQAFLDQLNSSAIIDPGPEITTLEVYPNPQG